MESVSQRKPFSFMLKSHGSYDLNGYLSDAYIPFKSQLNSALEKISPLKIKVRFTVKFLEDLEEFEGDEVEHCSSWSFENESEWIDYTANIGSYYRRCVVRYINEKIGEDKVSDTSLHSGFVLIVHVSDLREVNGLSNDLNI